MRPAAHEIPPTAGLPPRWRDLWPVPRADLAERLAEFLQVEEVQLECSGTAALIIALSAMARLSRRRVVVAPAWTCPLVALAVAHCGLELRLCDFAQDSVDLDPRQLAERCDRELLALLPTHLGGRVADVAAARAAAERVGAFVIEDAASALGARQDGRSVGLVGDAGFFSLAVGKGLSTFEGGVLLSRDPRLRAEFARVAREIAPRRVSWELRRSLELAGYHLLYRPTLLGLAYGWPLRRALERNDPIAAVGDDFSSRIPLHTLGAWRRGVGARAFERLPEFLASGAARAAARRAQLVRIRGLRVFDDPPGAQGTWPFLLLGMPSQAARDAVLERLWRAGLGVSRLFIHALPDYSYLRNLVPDVEVPQARRLAATTLTVSNSPWLDEVRFTRIADVLAEEVGRGVAEPARA